MKKTILNINSIVYLLILLVFLFINKIFFIGNLDLKIFINIFLIILTNLLILYIFNMDFIFWISFLTTILLIPSCIVYYHLTSGNYGDISLGFVPIYLYNITVYIYLFITIFSFVAFIIGVNKIEIKFINMPYLHLNKISIYINNFIAIVFSIVAFPRIPNLQHITTTANRFAMLLPGHAWNQLAIVALIFNLPYIFKIRSVFFTYIIIIIWFVFNGERADISGLLLGIFILSILSEKISNNKKLISIVFLFLSFLVFIIIGFDRINGRFPNIIEIIANIGTFSTVSDVTYLLNVSVDYTKHIGYTNGRLFLDMIESAIPFVYKDLSPYFNSMYLNPGGNPLLLNLIMDGGALSVSLFSIVYSVLIKLLTINRNLIIKYEFLVLIFSIPRISWYGINYIFTSMIFFIPFIYYLDIYLNKNLG